MIIPMQKYTFFVYYKEYRAFLEKIQELGALHVIEKENVAVIESDEKLQLINELNWGIQFLENRGVEKMGTCSNGNALEILKDIQQKQSNLNILQQELAVSDKELSRAEPWGEFSIESIQKLKEKNIHLRFFVTSKKKYQEFLDRDFPVELISEQRNKLHFALIQKGDNEIDIDADELSLPEHSYSEVKARVAEIQNKVEQINTALDLQAANSIPLLEACKNNKLNSLNFDEVIANTSAEADEKLMVLEGWVPESRKTAIDDFSEREKVLFAVEKANLKDKVPILLKNNRFSKLFEPVGAMFSLPSYSELDLTVFFAPFFMMFFGFCLGDAGYGLLFVVGAGLYKFKAKKEIKSLLSLIQFLGLATIVFGAISGTFFGINLIETEIPLIAEYKSLFLNPDKMFNLALLLGGIQIIYGLFIKAANQIKQYGFTYSLATLGWLIAILGGVLYAILTGTGVITESKTVLYSILSTGGFFILFFSDPEINVFARVGKGVWDIYSTVTGIFGDLLSYIRLFALGLSSAILGFVINDIAMQILGASKIMGPIFFVIFLLLGHTLNIMISSLGSFVHPMRLTFVEFYKNAGFTGGGEGYKPFQNNLKQ